MGDFVDVILSKVVTPPGGGNQYGQSQTIISNVKVLAIDFSTGKFPSEPTNRTESYCYKDGTAAIDNTTVAQWANLAVGTKCPTGWEDVSGSGPLITDFPTFFKFCTINQANQGTGGAVICQGSKQ